MTTATKTTKTTKTEAEVKSALLETAKNAKKEVAKAEKVNRHGAGSTPSMYAGAFEKGSKKTAGKKAAPAAKKAADKKTEAPKGGKRTFPLTAKITVIVKENPKRPGTAAHDSFALYSKHHTVESFLKAGGTTADLNWDAKHNFIKIAA